MRWCKRPVSPFFIQFCRLTLCWTVGLSDNPIIIVCNSMTAGKVPIQQKIPLKKTSRAYPKNYEQLWHDKYWTTSAGDNQVCVSMKMKLYSHRRRTTPHFLYKLIQSTEHTDKCTMLTLLSMASFYTSQPVWRPANPKPTPPPAGPLLPHASATLRLVVAAIRSPHWSLLLPRQWSYSTISVVVEIRRLSIT